VKMSVEQRPALESWRPTTPDDAPLAVDGLLPRYVSTPASVEELGATLRHANEHGLVVIPRGGGTKMGLGFPPSAADVLLQTTRLNRVVDYEPADLTLTVEAGATLAEVQRLLRPEGQFLALDPPCPERATLGGVIASNASGPLRLAYGSARDLVIGTRVVNADGVATRAGGRVVKNVAGYDLNKLYIGSLGTVGVVVELSFKLWPLPPAQATLLAAFDAQALRAALTALLRTPLAPLSLEALSQPAALACASHDPGPDRWLLALRFGGGERALARQVGDAERLFADAGAAHVTREGDEASALWDRLADYAAAAPDEVVLRVAVPPAQTVPALETLARLARAAGISAGLQARAGSGVSYAKLSPPDGWSAAALAAVAELVRQARAWAVGQGGSAVLEAAPPALKAEVDVWGDVGPSLRVMRALKQQLDPCGTLNRGRFVAGM